MAMYFADDAVIVTNPEVSSVRDSDRILGLLQSRTLKAEQGEVVREHLLINRYNPERVASGDMLALEDILDILAVPLIGVIPESGGVLQASNSGNPVILDSESTAGQAYDDFVKRFLGETVPHRFLEVEKKGIFKRKKKPNSAQLAKERLQIVIAHERVDRSGPDYLPQMRRDIMAVINKYVPIDEDQ
ncbi:unnamed protein product, partial [Cyprideis torosa]